MENNHSNESQNIGRKYIYIDSAVWNHFAQTAKGQDQFVSYIEKHDFTVLINKQLIIEIVQYSNEKAVAERISLIKRISKLFTLTGPSFILGYFEIAFLYLWLQGKKDNDLIPKFMVPIMPEHIDQYIQGAINEVPETQKQRASYSHTLLMGKANAHLSDNAHKLTLPELDDLLRKNQFHVDPSFSDWANNYQKYIGKGIKAEEQGNHLQNAVNILQSADIKNVIAQMRKEISDYNISGEIVNKEALSDLNERIYLCRQFQTAIEYLPSNDQNLEAMYSMLSSRDFRHFPGHLLFYKVTHLLNKSESKTKASETFDLLSLFISPFIHTFTSDDQIKETIRQALKVYRIPLNTNFIANKVFQKEIEYNNPG